MDFVFSLFAWYFAGLRQLLDVLTQLGPLAQVGTFIVLTLGVLGVVTLLALAWRFVTKPGTPPTHQ